MIWKGFWVLLLGLCPSAQASESWSVGVDAQLPYVLVVGGTSTHQRQNLDAGLTVRRFWTEAFESGLRLSIDTQGTKGKRQIMAEPGVSYRWMSEQVVYPFLRADLPVRIRSPQDLAISGGAGLAWRLTPVSSKQRLSLRYDFDFAYFFGLGRSLSAVQLTVGRLGFDVRF